MPRARHRSGSGPRRSAVFLGLVATAILWGCPGPSPQSPDASVDADTFHDPLSRPVSPTLDMSSFGGSGACTTCHATHVAQWQTSMHSYAMIDPVFRALVAVRQADFSGAQDQFCTQCHTVIGTRGGDIVPGFSFDDLSEVTLEGVTCEVCHKTSGVEREFNSGLVMDPNGPLRGPISDPIDAVLHETEYSPLHQTSELCGACHDIRELDGLALERPYAEWQTSPAAADGRSCQSCHMRTYRGQVTSDAPERDLHEHWFSGVDVPLTDGYLTPEEMDAAKARVVELLDGSASMSIEVPASVTAGEQLDLVIHVQNNIDGHNLPTGSTFIRQLWLEVIVRDAAGDVVYETGTLDDNGDLRDFYSELDPYGDNDLVTFNSSLIGPDGTPEVFTWRATEHFLRSIPPLHERTVTLFVPTTGETMGPLSIETRLRFRTHPPFLLRRLGLPELVDRVQTYDIATASGSVEVAVP